jgi:para-nitrobenzyl esterase
MNPNIHITKNNEKGSTAMSSREAIVVTTGGKVEGTYQDSTYIFKGIPYAARPVGALRWLPPQPAERWDGVRPAREFGPIAPQNPMVGGPIVHVEQPQDEDCLFLNVWTPGLDDARRPVMVWIHGGAFSIGSGSEPMYDSDKLPRRGNAVMVTINYRLGMLGFLRLKEATGGKIPATGNEGLLDQIAALKWVRDNIAAFGGDPANVTVFGESAGAMSIGCLMAMPAARGLFHKAILESGVGSTAVPLEQARAVAERFLEIVNIRGGDADALRALTPQRFLEADTRMRTELAGPGEAVRLTVVAPVIDGELIPEVTNEAARKGSAKDVPAIIGTNLEEFKLFNAMLPPGVKIDEADLFRRLGAFLNDSDARKVVEVYRAARQKRGEPAGPADILTAIQTDLMFRIPALGLIEAQQANGQKAYSYLFTWKSPVMGGALGACHALEIGFVFGKYDDMFCGTGPEADRLSEGIQDAWLAFARTGDPSTGSFGQWPVYGKDRMTMLLGRDSHVEAAPYDEERRAWEGIEGKSPMP